MMRRTTLAAALLLAAAPLALAQPAPPPPPPGGPGGPQAQERGPDRDRGDRGPGRERDRERGDRHEREERGERRGPPHRHDAGGASFRLEMGPMGSLTVRCGDQPVAECVTAAQPLIDAVSGGMGMPPEPTSAPLVVPLPPVEPQADDGLDVPLPPGASPEGTALPDALSGEDDASVESITPDEEVIIDDEGDGPPIETIQVLPENGDDGEGAPAN